MNMDALHGMLKSKTAWLGALIIGLPDLWPLIQDDVLGLSGDYQALVTRLMGIAVILVRFLTTQSLASKGEKW